MSEQSHNLVYSHLKGNKLTRGEFIERKVLQIILNSKMPDAQRVWSKAFELKHSSSVAQFGRVLAQKRGLDPELGAVICVMHDIYVNQTGMAKDHAHKGALIAEKILRQTKKFTNAEIKLITNAIYNHSDKHIVSKDPYVELVKDADAFDCGLLPGAHDAYLFEKPLDNCKKYFGRMKSVRKELNLPKDPRWDIFEYIERGKKVKLAKHK